ncbi:dual specificity protein phosphatase-like protein [Wolffia australiana]
MPHLVREGLFIGKIDDAADVLTKGVGEITHLLSLLSSASISFFTDWKASMLIPSQEIRKVFAGESGTPSGSDDEGEISPKKAIPEGKLVYTLERAGQGMKIVRLAVPLRDMEDENLLDRLDVCLDFIDSSRKEGSILVHCFAGVSRSAAIVTAYLMKTERKSLEDALESLVQVCEFVCPNDGFMDQLKMFEEMGFKVDLSSPTYKRFRLKMLGDSYNRGHKIDSSIFGADPGLPPQQRIPEVPHKPASPAAIYRCKKCRRVIALQDNVVIHTPGEGESCFTWQKRRSGNPFNRHAGPDCSSIFVEPLRWMTEVEGGGLEGKLSCIHCDARLGYFNWSGIQCSCGSWITPAFQIHKNRVDISAI